MNPFSKWIVVEKSPKEMAKAIIYYSDNSGTARINIAKCYEWAKTQSWENEVKKYLNLWGLGNSK
jgi:glycosyltransferase involved in cell wall biosynthesis